jgi:hypothetical protein
MIEFKPKWAVAAVAAHLTKIENVIKDTQK